MAPEESGESRGKITTEGTVFDSPEASLVACPAVAFCKAAETKPEEVLLVLEESKAELAE